MVESRKVRLSQFNIISIENLNVNFEIKCSKGTYVRSIANDFGLALNSGGHLSKLCRTSTGNYQLSKSIDIETFEDPLKALEYVQTEAVNLALVDYMMPKMDGIEFIKQIKQLHSNIPVVMVTAVAGNQELKIEVPQEGGAL